MQSRSRVDIRCCCRSLSYKKCFSTNGYYYTVVAGITFEVASLGLSSLHGGDLSALCYRELIDEVFFVKSCFIVFFHAFMV